jgi:hypothetical protein
VSRIERRCAAGVVQRVVHVVVFHVVSRCFLASHVVCGVVRVVQKCVAVVCRVVPDPVCERSNG